MKIGVVGLGFVGQATYEGLRDYYDVTWTDKADTPMGEENATDYERTLDDRVTIDEMVDYDMVFVCVPTPMNEDGSANTDIVETVVFHLNKLSLSLTSVAERLVVVIKSTVPAGTTQDLNYECRGLSLVFNPEFLTEANYLADFRNQTNIVIGGNHLATTKVKQMYSLPFPQVRTIKTDSTTAEMVKYMINTFLATKVSFANEISQICAALEVDYDKVMEYATQDPRLGTSHWNVPGPDGKHGFGGSCFPKDVNALIALARQYGVKPHTLEGAWETNLRVRPEQDWKELKGRAVTE